MFINKSIYEHTHWRIAVIYQNKTVSQQLQYSTMFGAPVVSTTQEAWGGVHIEMSSILADQERPRIWAQMREMGEGGGVAGSQPYARVDLNPNMPELTLSPSQVLWIWPPLCTWSPNKLCRSAHLRLINMRPVGQNHTGAHKESLASNHALQRKI